VSTDYQWVAEQLTFNPRFSDGARAIEAFGLLSARIAYTHEGEVRTWQYSLSGENLTNQPYEYRPGYPMPGLQLNFGIRMDW